MPEPAKLRGMKSPRRHATREAADATGVPDRAVRARTGRGGAGVRQPRRSPKS